MKRWGWASDLVILIAIALVVAGLLFLAMPRTAEAACRPAPEVNPVWYPTNCVGDVAYGAGDASTWSGPGVARNDCTYPFDDCVPIRITYQGTSVTVTPTQYCDCWRGLEPGTTGPLGERPRLVDLDPHTWQALGIPGPGIWPVTVCPIHQPATSERGASWEACSEPATTSSPALPDTAIMP